MCWLFFWMQGPFDNDITEDDWCLYLESLSWEFLFFVVVFVAIICGLYTYFTRRLTFEDLLRPFWPTRFLWIALVPGIIIGIRAMMLFDSMENLSGKGGAIAAAISSGFFAVVVTALVAWLSFLLPGVTPPMFKLRPIKWLLGSSWKKKNV
jgi:hypothetical protein